MFTPRQNPNIKRTDTGIEHLRRSIAPGAVHDSDERYDPPKCHPHTREAVLQEIMDWVKDSNRGTRILWMYGAAGAGKSAIEQTIAEWCYQMNLLAASFFFSRSVNGRNNKTFLITTIVDQLIVSIPEIREHVGITITRVTRGYARPYPYPYPRIPLPVTRTGFRTKRAQEHPKRMRNGRDTLK